MSARFEPSDEQRAAIYAPDDVLVRAGAGSGKTEVLARRFVAILAGDIEGRAGLLPEQVAAMTFNEKATRDMQARITAVLVSRIEQAREDCEAVGKIAHLERCRRRLGLARISTIHAFCARILRENPIEAALDPNFEVLDEDQSATMLERECEQTLIAILRASDPGAVALMRARGLRDAYYTRGALSIVVGLVGGLERLGKDGGWLIECASRLADETRARSEEVALCAHQLCELVEQLTLIKIASGVAQERIEQLKARWPKLKPVALAFNSESDPSALDALRDLAELLPSAQSATIKALVQSIKSLLDKSGKGVGISGQLIDLWGEQRAVQPTLDIARTVATIAGKIAERKRAEGVVTFDDLLSLSLRLLRDHPEGARRYRGTLRALLVDEYQDTDPIQHAVVTELTRRADGELAPELFIVGDEKQSIYRFRGADVAVFRRRREPEPLLRRLQHNRRSAPSLLEFANALSASVMRHRDGPAPGFVVEWSEEHRLIPDRPALDAAPAIEVLLCSDEKNPVADKRRAEAGWIARRCRELIETGTQVSDRRSAGRAARFGDIAILMRSFESVRIYEDGLRAADVPFYTVKGRGFFACQEIRDIADLLAAIDEPSSEIALAAALRSPLIGLSDQCLLELALGHEGPRPRLSDYFRTGGPDPGWLDERHRHAVVRARTILSELRAMKDGAPLAEMIERAVELTDFEAVMVAQSEGPQRVANVRKLIELARDFDSRRMLSFPDFIRHLGRLIDAEPYEPQAQILGEDEDVVRLMTIHQAKGLEFPIVFLADLGRRPPTRESQYLLSPDDGLLMRDTLGSGQDAVPNPRIEKYNKLLGQQDEAESARLLYVAITRARDRLILSEGSKPDRWAEQVREFIGKDRIGSFLNSSDAQRSINAGGVDVLLHRPPASDAMISAQAASPTRTSREADDAVFAELARRRLQFEPPPAREMVASPTELECFDRCPRQYWYRHILAMPDGEPFAAAAAANGSPSRPRKRASALEMGQAAHAALERIRFGAAARDTQGELDAALEAAAAEAGLGKADIATLRGDLLRYLVQHSPDERIAGREVPFFLAVADDENLTVFVRGRIDLLAEADGALIVRDYKYARFSVDSDAEQYRLQMECYALAAAQAYDGRSVRAELIFIRGECTPVALDLPAPETIRTRLVSIGREMTVAARTSQYAMKPPSADVCRSLGCGYIRRCWGGAAA
jgi:ATP-dependent helicase/nuclease subunit A